MVAFCGDCGPPGGETKVTNSSCARLISNRVARQVAELTLRINARLVASTTFIPLVNFNTNMAGKCLQFTTWKQSNHVKCMLTSVTVLCYSSSSCFRWRSKPAHRCSVDFFFFLTTNSFKFSKNMQMLYKFRNMCRNNKYIALKKSMLK